MTTDIISLSSPGPAGTVENQLNHSCTAETVVAKPITQEMAYPAALIRAAYHEAGHATAACLLGVAFNTVHIIESSVMLGAMEGENTQYDYYPDGAALEELERNTIVLFAGVVAANRYTGSAKQPWKGSEKDFTLAFCMAMARHPEGSFDEVYAFLKYAWTRAGELFRPPHHWAATQALASELLARRRLTYEEVAKVISGALSFHRKKHGPPFSDVERVRLSATLDDVKLARSNMFRGFRMHQFDTDEEHRGVVTAA
jgi:hypothetical protein